MSRFERIHKDQETRLYRRIEDKFSEITSDLTEKLDKISYCSSEKSKKFDSVCERRKNLTTNILNFSIIEEENSSNLPQELENSLSGFEGILEQ